MGKTGVHFEHYFAKKSFAAVPKSFSNVYPNKEVQNKTTMHRMATFWDTELSVCL